LRPDLEKQVKEQGKLENRAQKAEQIHGLSISLRLAMYM